MFPQVENTQGRVNELLPYAERVSEHIQAVYSAMRDVFINNGLTSALILSFVGGIEQKANTSEMILNDIINITSIPLPEDFSDEVVRTAALLTRSEQITSQLVTYLRYARIQLSQAVNISLKYKQIGEQGTDLTNQIISLQNNLSVISELFNTVTAKLPQLLADITTVNDVITFAESTIENTDSELIDLQISLMRIRNEIQELADLIGEKRSGSDEISGSGFGSSSGIGSGFESGMGSGNEEEIRLFEPEDGMATTIQMGVSLLAERMTGVREELEECARVLQQAEDHVTSLRDEAREINK